MTNMQKLKVLMERREQMGRCIRRKGGNATESEVEEYLKFVKKVSDFQNLILRMGS